MNALRAQVLNLQSTLVLFLCAWISKTILKVFDVILESDVLNSKVSDFQYQECVSVYIMASDKVGVFETILQDFMQTYVLF